jgi:hypothetical protein
MFIYLILQSLVTPVQVASEAKPGVKLGRWNKSPNQRVQGKAARAQNKLQVDLGFSS